MIFDLNARWAIQTEERQVIICKKTIAKEGKNKGKTNYKQTYYYNNFEQALEGLIDRDINGLEKVEVFVARILELKSEIKSLLKSAKKAVSDAFTRDLIAKESYAKYQATHKKIKTVKK